MDREKDILTDVSVVLPAVVVSWGASASSTAYSWDYQAVSTNFNQMATAINALNHEVRGLKSFLSWVNDVYPEVLRQYVDARQAEERLEGKK